LGYFWGGILPPNLGEKINTAAIKLNDHFNSDNKALMLSFSLLKIE
jgi:hypothetical protein